MNHWILAFTNVTFLYSFITFLHLILPARFGKGYASGGVPLYRFNGLRVYFLVSVLFLALAKLGYIDMNILFQLRYKHLISACILGLVLTCLAVLPYESTHPTRSVLIDLYLGRLKHPQLFGVDVKMLLFLIGSITLELNILIFYSQYSIYWEVKIFVALFSFFTADYAYYEHVYLYSLDQLLECVGFKLVWGALFIYPFIYPVVMYTYNPLGPHPSMLRNSLSIFAFFLGWILSRGASNQKYRFRTEPNRSFLGIKPKVIGTHLLCSGWWGITRHINYLGETLMGVGLTLVISQNSFIPWLFPLYYVCFFLIREQTDNERCQQKYGKVWEEYCRLVRYRIIPFIY